MQLDSFVSSVQFGKRRKLTLLVSFLIFQKKDTNVVATSGILDNKLKKVQEEKLDFKIFVELFAPESQALCFLHRPPK